MLLKLENTGLDAEVVVGEGQRGYDFCVMRDAELGVPSTPGWRESVLRKAHDKRGDLKSRGKEEAMQVPYANKWQKETDKLREIALGCDLTEEVKWGKPCFTFLEKNVAIIIPLKESCALAFFKGALLKDPKCVLGRAGEHTQAGRWIKFTSVKDIATLRITLRSYLYEAIELEESGKKVELRKPSEYTVPEELQNLLDDNAALKASFNALTPGRRKSYVFHISSAKQAKTRAARAERCVPMIQGGRGFNELPR
jgi:uncharacterized protein YdeI (YjbR/CyaY-like superfamily)